MVDIEVDDETGEVAVMKMNSAYELGRALNPKLVEQQLVGGAWMGMSHALWETTEPYYPDRSHGPVDFNDYLMPGPGRHRPTTSPSWSARAGRPVRRQGPRRDVRQPGPPRRRQRRLQRRRRAHHRPADHAREGAAGHQGQRRRRGRRRATLRRPRRWRRQAPTSSASTPGGAGAALRAAQYLADEGLATAAYLALALGKPLLLEGAPGVGKTEAAKAISAVLGARLIRLQCYEGIDAAAALYEWNYPRQMLAIRQAGEQTSTSTATTS